MKLYVGNIPHSLTEQQLAELFAAYTCISVKLILDRDTNRSRGFGFVEIESDDESNQAIQEMNGKEVEGRKLVVNEARQKERRSGPPSGGRSFNRDRDNRDNRRRY